MPENSKDSATTHIVVVRFDFASKGRRVAAMVNLIGNLSRSMVKEPKNAVNLPRGARQGEIEPRASLEYAISPRAATIPCGPRSSP